MSIATSWVLVTRLERVGERWGFSEALLGMVAALAADAPEITSSVSALSQHQYSIGAGVVIGSNVFNLAALLGLGAVVSGFISLHRRVVVLGGVVAMWVALWCLVSATGATSGDQGLAAVGVVMLAYVVLLGVPRTSLRRVLLPRPRLAWIARAVDEKELELEEAIHPPRGRPVDAWTALGALVIVVVSSVVMERAASRLGHHFHVADAVIGGVVLAAVTSLPNAVSAVYLATKGRGSAAFSTALNSNNLNVLAGLFVPATVIALAAPTLGGNVTAVSYVVLTGAVLVFAYLHSGIRRYVGWSIMAGYGVFVGLLVTVTWK